MKKPIQFGKYLLLDRINVGGMAEVFKAKAFGVEGFERLVAVKRILPNIAEDEEFITMFIDEAKIAVQLSHANVAQIFDLGKVDDAYFIALEFVQGKDLRAIFDRCKAKPVDGMTAMPLAQACFIIMKACEGLDYAHNKRDATGGDLNLVHRDVSPQNVLISYEGEVKLIDFGIAKAAGKASKTQQGILKGKFGYMSPEQVRGLPLDRRSDIFSVGIVLYELLTSERLFVGESDFSTLEKVRNVEILPPSTYNRRIPEELERICLKALAKDVEDRYQNAIDLHDDLQAFMYTAGEFYARKDLGAWMKRVYDEEIRAEQVKIESYQRLPAITTPPGNTGAQPSLPQRRPSGAFPTAPPPPPPQAIAPRQSQQMPALTATGTPAVLPSRGTEPSPMLTGSADAQRESDKPRVNGSHNGSHKGANGHANGQHAADLNWDDEELATNIYDDKAENAEDSVVSDLPLPSRPDLSRVELSMDGAPVPAAPRPATPSRGVPTASTRLTGTGLDVPFTYTDGRGHTRRRKSGSGLLVGGALAFVIAVIGVTVAYLYLGGRPGQIVITSEPSTGVQILIDNQRVPVDGTPATINKPPGSYALIVQHEGYVPYSEQIELRSRDVIKKHAQLEPLTSGTGFQLKEPIGAQVYLDGKLLDGQTPLQVQSVMPGKHKVEVRGAYGAWVEEIVLEAGRTTELHPVFPNAPTPVAQRPEPAHVAHDPVPVAPRDPAPAIPRDPPPVRHAPPVASTPRAPDPAPRERPVRVGKKTAPDDEGDLAPVSPRVAERPSTPSGAEGYLRVNSKPWTNISIDGKDTGLHTPQTHIKLSPGSHRVILSNPQFGVRDAFTVDIGAGATETVVKDLRVKDAQGDD